MIDQEELLLVDGPGAGKRVRADPNWSSSYVYTAWPSFSGLTMDFSAIPSTTFTGPTHTYYRTGFARNLDGRVIRVGWSSGKPEPDPEKLEFWLRYEPSVKVVADAGSRLGRCDFGTRMGQLSTTIQGVCACGWETETVPRRRTREVLELVDAHRKVSTSLIMGMGIGTLGTHVVREAIRYEALLIRAEAVGMSRSQAEAVFRDEEFRSYGFDEAIEHLEHRIHQFAMYGYMPLALRDVLTQREIETQVADSTTVLNSPRWMDRPLGQQFAEMGRERQRTLVRAAIEVTEQLGGDAEGWPLERAMAAVMPCKEDA
ncbi:MAG: hypothetical protein HOY79_17725 [Streptomyces sp.]|nr:hypothetical protein [Streptomyces sp.]